MKYIIPSAWVVKYVTQPPAVGQAGLKFALLFMEVDETSDEIFETHFLIME